MRSFKILCNITDKLNIKIYLKTLLMHSYTKIESNFLRLCLLNYIISYTILKIS